MLVPSNMNFLQSLDLTVNSYVKKLMCGKFNAWYLQIGNQLDAGRQWQDIDVPLRLSLEALPCRMVGRMLQPHDNYSCAKCHSKWMEGRRNYRNSLGWSHTVGVTWSVSRDWPIDWVRRRWKKHNFQCYQGWHSSFKVEVFGGHPTWLRFW